MFNEQHTDWGKHKPCGAVTPDSAFTISNQMKGLSAEKHSFRLPRHEITWSSDNDPN